MLKFNDTHDTNGKSPDWDFPLLLQLRGGTMIVIAFSIDRCLVISPRDSSILGHEVDLSNKWELYEPFNGTIQNA